MGSGNPHLNPEMLESGKPRPERPEEEEDKDPLVPHGMIWYGTPETPPQPKHESLEPTVQYARVMEMMRRRGRAPLPQQSRQEAAAPREPAAGAAPSAPIPWWRVPQPDPDPVPSAAPTAAAVTADPKPALPSKVEAITPPPPRTVSYIPVATNVVRKEAPVVRKEIEVREVREVREVKDLKKEVKEIRNDARKDGPARAQAPAWAGAVAVLTRAVAVLTRAAAVLTGAAAVLNDFLRNSLAYPRRWTERGKRLFARPARTIPAPEAPRWKPPHARIALTGLPLRMKILAARRLSDWKVRSAAPGFRSAVIIAAACILVALVGVSLTSRFRASFLPGHGSGSGSLEGAKPLPPPAPAAQPSPSRVAAGPQSPDLGKSRRTPAAARPHEKKPPPPRPEKHRKHRHMKDDDYVAPNTYKYYGNGVSR